MCSTAARSLNPNSVHHANLSRNNICDDGDAQKVVYALSRLTALQSLDLSYNDLRACKGCSLGACIAQLTDLQSLDLTHCHINEDNSSELGTALPKCAKLRELK